MPPKKVSINNKMNEITVKSTLSTSVKSGSEQFVGGKDKTSKKNIKAVKPIKTTDSEDENDDDELEEVESEEDTIERPDESANDSEEEDENNIDDDEIVEEEYKETKEKDDMEEIDDVDEEDIADDIKDEDDDKSVNDENISGNMDIADCLLDDEQVVEDGEPTMVEPENRISRPKLTKYERVRILAARTKQLAMGAPPLVKNVFGKSPIEIAEIELSFKMIPFKIKRPMPNNTFEIWKLSELDIQKLGY